MQVELDEATTRWFELVDLAHHGHTVVIAKGGMPMARLAPLDRPGESADSVPVMDPTPTPPNHP